MTNIQYITIEYGRGYQIFSALHSMYITVHSIEPRDEDEKFSRQKQLDVLEELLVYLAVRLHIKWEGIDENKDEAQGKDQVEIPLEKKGVLNANTG